MVTEGQRRLEGSDTENVDSPGNVDMIFPNILNLYQQSIFLILVSHQSTFFPSSTAFSSVPCKKSKTPIPPK